MPRVTLVLTAVISLLIVTGCGVEARTPPPPVQYSTLSSFPPLGPALPVDRGIVVHQVSLAHGAQPGRIWIYLPKKLPKHPIPCVFIAPAGVPAFAGNGFGPDLDRQKDPEHLPYVRAGFAVVAYDTDGEVADRDNVTYEQVQAAATAFRDSEAGMLNARHAIDYVLKMVPAIDAKRLYAAGHSSAGRESLLLAESDPRIAACVAYAPVTDAERRAEISAPDATRYLSANLPGFREFLARTSPIKQAARLRCPTFVFHSRADERIPIADTEAFVTELSKTNNHVTFVKGANGGHYDSMIEEGVPQAIRWLEQWGS